MSKWTDEEVDAIIYDCGMLLSHHELGRALLDAREQVATLKAECDNGSCPSATHERMAAAQSVPLADMKRLQQQVDTLKAEVKAWRDVDFMYRHKSYDREAIAVYDQEALAARAATDALFKEGL